MAADKFAMSRDGEDILVEKNLPNWFIWLANLQGCPQRCWTLRLFWQI